jgi:hypothetical protein
MALVKIRGSNDNAQRLLDVWGLTASTVAEGEEKIAQRIKSWLREQLLEGELVQHERLFAFTEPDFEHEP